MLGILEIKACIRHDYLHIHLYIAKINQQADDTSNSTNLHVWKQDCEVFHTFTTLNRVKQTCRGLVTGISLVPICVQPKIPQQCTNIQFQNIVSGKNTYATKSGCNPKKADGTSNSNCC